MGGRRTLRARRAYLAPEAWPFVPRFATLPTRFIQGCERQCAATCSSAVFELPDTSELQSVRRRPGLRMG
jgi:hypothetical protein